MRHLPTPFSLRRALCASFAVAALSAFALPAAHAQSYPNKPIKFVVPFSAGSATDNVGRILAQAMGEAMGQPITVENKAGANGILGAEVVKAALPTATPSWSPPAPPKPPMCTCTASCRMTL